MSSGKTSLPEPSSDFTEPSPAQAEEIPNSTQVPLADILSPKRQTEELELLAGQQGMSAEDRFASNELPSSTESPRSTTPRWNVLFGGANRCYPGVMHGIWGELIDAGIDASWADRLIQLAQQQTVRGLWEDPLTVKARMVQWVQQQIPIAPPLEDGDGTTRQVVAVVGPTGVGKTTTLAKLAAGLTLDHRRQVGLITIDTFRIGAIEQLRRYAQIMHLPMRVVESHDAMRAACQDLQSCDVVLIDTTGRNPGDSESLESLRQMLEIAAPTQTHLVLSIASGAGSYRHAFHRYAAVQPNRLILSKLDESAGTGTLLPQLSQSSLPISYVTTGQNVPQDIQPARSVRLAAFLLDQCGL
jgi:flagellar biosynthesis protein FlhF